jgi:AcrR family transcriptional regulator
LPRFINTPMKERIQQKARELFMRYGFRSVTMDEIAGQTGVSKKTLYQFFEDKDALVEAVMHAELEYMQTQCTKQVKEAKDAIEEIFLDMDSMEDVMDAMNPQIIFDLEKFYPRTFEKFKKHKNNFLLDVIKKNLERGIEEEVYRDDFDIDIIARFRLESAFVIFNPELFPHSKYSLLKVSNEIYYHYLYGLATSKGKKLIEKYIQQRKKSKSVAV